MRKDKISFRATVGSIMLVVMAYILKNLSEFYEWDKGLQILFNTYLMGINLFVLCLTFVSKIDMDEILKYNPHNNSEKHKNRKFVKWFRNIIKTKMQWWKLGVILVVIVIGEICLLFFNDKIDVIAICSVVLDIMTVVGIGSAFAQIYINSIIYQHLYEKNEHDKQ